MAVQHVSAHTFSVPPKPEAGAQPSKLALYRSY